MSPRLRRLTSQELLAALRGLGFEVVAVRGSHAKLHRIAPDGSRQVLTIPLHRDLALGTLQAILRQVSRFVPAEVLEPIFYRDR